MLSALTESEELELLDLLEQEDRERVAPKFEEWRNHYRYKIAYGGRGAGAKCLKVGTLVWMYNGVLKPIEEIQVGDKVMGPDGKPRNVLSLSQGYGQLWRVSQKNAIDYVVNNDHIICLSKAKWAKNDNGPFIKHGYKRPNGSYASWPDLVDIPIQEYIDQSARWKDNFLGYKAPSLPYKKKKVTIPPYIFGAWLGDGNSREAGITTMDQEVIKEFRDYCMSLGLLERIYSKVGTKNRAKTYVYTTGNTGQKVKNLFIGKLKAYDVQCNKHIPVDYLTNNENTRLELLAGLIDTDGTLRGNRSGYVFSQSDEKLSREVKQLADSLGFRTSINKSKTKCGCNEFPYYRVNISGDIWRIPCRIKRKKVEKESFKRNKGWRVTGIDVESAGDGNWAGIMIDGDHRFLLEDGTVTHNSWSAVSLIVQRCEERHTRVACLRETQISLEESVYSLVKQTVERLGYTGWIFQRDHIENTKNGSRLIFRGLKDLKAASQLKSLNDYDIFLIEEAAPVTHDSWTILLPTLRKADSELWAIFNREEEMDPVYERFVINRRENSCILDLEPGATDNPWWDQTALPQEMAEDFKYDPDEAEHIWYGQPRKQGHKSIIGRARIRAAMDRSLEAEGGIAVGCDPADFGDDKTEIYIRKGLKIIDHLTIAKQDGHYIAHEIGRLIKNDPSIPIRLDTTGIGTSARDELKAMGLKVIPINFAYSARDKDKYPDIVTEMWFELPIDEIDIPDDPQLMRELSGRQYSYDSKNRVKIEPKAHYKKRGNNSPDKADAIILCYSNSGAVMLDREARDAMRARRGRK